MFSRIAAYRPVVSFGQVEEKITEGSGNIIDPTVKFKDLDWDNPKPIVKGNTLYVGDQVDFSKKKAQPPIITDLPKIILPEDKE